jgi:hypothetical protein
MAENHTEQTIGQPLDNILHQSGGGGVVQSIGQEINITTTDSVESVIALEDLQPGDIVESEKLPLGLRGWGKVASICDDQVFVELSAKAIPIDSITFVRREK